jgi:AcrR family transcriptional regulator
VTTDDFQAIHWTPSAGRSVPASGRGKRTRDAVLDAAIAVFGREGVRQTSMLAIAEEAGVASGTVYQYFADKEDVFSCLLAGLEENLRRNNQLITDEGRLDESGALLAYLAVHRRNVAIYRAWWDLLEPRTEFTEAWKTLHERFRQDIESVIRRGQEDGTVHGDIDAAIVSELLVMMFERSAYSRNIMVWDEEVTDEDLDKIVSRMLGTGLLRASAG